MGATLLKRARAIRRALASDFVEPSMWRVRTTVEKYDPETVRQMLGDLRIPEIELTSARMRELCPPDRITEAEYNKVINAGMILVFNYMIGTGSLAFFTNTTSRLGVGDGLGSVPTEANTDVGLAATTNRYFAGMQATYPNITGTAPPQLNFQAQYASGNGNFVWNEWSVDNATTAGTALPGNTATAYAAGGISALNHRGVGLGTKVSGAVWTLTVNVTVT